MQERNAPSEAGKHRDRGIKTVKGQDNEGHIQGSKQTAFSERQAQEAQQRDKESPLNRTAALSNTSGTEQV